MPKLYNNGLTILTVYYFPFHIFRERTGVTGPSHKNTCKVYDKARNERWQNRKQGAGKFKKNKKFSLSFPHQLFSLSHPCLDYKLKTCIQHNIHLHQQYSSATLQNFCIYVAQKSFEFIFIEKQKKKKLHEDFLPGILFCWNNFFWIWST